MSKSNPQFSIFTVLWDGELINDWKNYIRGSYLLSIFERWINKREWFSIRYKYGHNTTHAVKKILRDFRHFVYNN